MKLERFSCNEKFSQATNYTIYVFILMNTKGLALTWSWYSIPVANPYNCKWVIQTHIFKDKFKFWPLHKDPMTTLWRSKFLLSTFRCRWSIVIPVMVRFITVISTVSLSTYNRGPCLVSFCTSSLHEAPMDKGISYWAHGQIPTWEYNPNLPTLSNMLFPIFCTQICATDVMKFHGLGKNPVRNKLV